MKVFELFEQHEPASLTMAEFSALQQPSAKNIDDRYKVGQVAFDSEHGVGAVPNNQDIKYLGFAMELTPADFLHLAATGDRTETAQQIVDLIKRQVPLGPPTLKLNVSLEDGSKKPLAEVATHDGRARMEALQLLGMGDVKVPVHIAMNGGHRAHSLDVRFFEKLREEGIIPEDFSSLGAHEPDIGRIFWRGKEL